MSDLERIEAAMEEKVRPALRSHGGDISIDHVEGKTVYVKLLGQCAGCPSADLTNETIVEAELKLKISVITTKRAYEELEKDGFLYTIPAKGCYVAPRNVELLREENLKKIEEHIDEALRLALEAGLAKERSKVFRNLIEAL